MNKKRTTYHLKRTGGNHSVIAVLITVCLLFFSICAGSAANVAKRRASYFTDEKVHIATENIRRYAWAQKEKAETVDRADRWLLDYHYDYGLLWDIVPSQMIPRSFAVNSFGGCLACGTAINKHGNYAYQFRKDRIDWKLTCPNCHLSFPANDFEAYYQGGLNERKEFIPELALFCDQSLIMKGEKGNLINRYMLEGLSDSRKDSLRKAGVPDSVIMQIVTDPTWGTDNSMGYRFDPTDGQTYGNPYTYIAYYTHWALWYGILQPMLEDFSKAYMYTRLSDNREEQKKSQVYADAAIILLDRIADLYPDLYVASFPHNGYFGFPNSDGFHSKQSRGRIVGSIWENTLIKNIMYAYDAVYPGIDRISEKTRQTLDCKSGYSGKGKPDRIKVNFEDGILREVAKAYVTANLQGNPGMHQSSLALAAVVIDHNPETRHWLNMIYKNGNAGWEGDGERDGGNIMTILVNHLDRDGQGDEVSLGYNAGWLDNWLVVAKVLDGYQLPDGCKLEGGIDPDLYTNYRFRKLFEANYPLLLTDNYIPHIGDTGSTGNPSRSIINPDHLILGYDKFGTPGLAQAVYLLKKKKLEDIIPDIFTRNPDAIRENIQKEIDSHGELRLSSQNFSAYGLAILRDGSVSYDTLQQTTQRAMWMFYGARRASHNHSDPLNLGYIAYDLDLMPDFGYPNTMGGLTNPEQQWDKSTPAHNTVSFDTLGYAGHVVAYGKPLHFDDTQMVKLIHIDADEVSNGKKRYAGQYDRTSALIRINDEDSYLVDLFRVDSPYAYVYNFHTAEVDNASTCYDRLVVCNDRTVTYNEKTLRNVQPAVVEGDCFSIDWNVLDTWNRYGKGYRAPTDIHVKITISGSYEGVRIGEAVPPTNNGKNPVWLPMLMVSNAGKTTFTSVIEAFKGKSKIASVDLLSVMDGSLPADSQIVKAIRVRLADGRTDYIVNSLDTKKTYRIAGAFDFSGFFGVYSENKEGNPVVRYIHDGVRIGNMVASNRITGIITDATEELSDSNYLEIKTDRPVDALSFSGKYIYVNNNNIAETSGLRKYNAVYRISNALQQSDSCFRLDLGTCSIIRGWKDTNDYSKGYVRDFEIGTDFYIPLSKLYEGK